MSSPVVFWIFCVCSTRKVVGPDWIVYKHSTVLSCKLMSPWFSLLDPKVVWMQTSIVCIGSRDSSRLKKKKKLLCEILLFHPRFVLLTFMFCGSQVMSEPIDCHVTYCWDCNWAPTLFRIFLTN
jgi:hypothetical protein